MWKSACILLGALSVAFVASAAAKEHNHKHNNQTPSDVEA
jgi:hypothetical protein